MLILTTVAAWLTPIRVGRASTCVIVATISAVSLLRQTVVFGLCTPPKVGCYAATVELNCAHQSDVSRRRQHSGREVAGVLGGSEHAVSEKWQDLPLGRIYRRLNLEGCGRSRL